MTYSGSKGSPVFGRTTLAEVYCGDTRGSARSRTGSVSCVANKVYGESLSNLTLDPSSPEHNPSILYAVHCKISMGSLKSS